MPTSDPENIRVPKAHPTDTFGQDGNTVWTPQPHAMPVRLL